MGRRKREPMSEGKKNIIGMLLEEYDIRYHRPPSSADRGLAETSSGRGLSHCIYCCCTFFCTRKRTDKKTCSICNPCSKLDRSQRSAVHTYR